MDNQTLAIHLHELRNLVHHTQAAYDFFNNFADQNQSQGVLYAGQLILTTTSQLAVALWPSRARSRKRGEDLRKVLGLGEKHALSDRRLTELCDRQDEKLDEWISATKNERLVIDFIGDPATMQIRPEDAQGAVMSERGIYRAYNPANQVFYLRGIPYNLQALAKAVNEVAERIMTVYARMFPEQVKREEEARKMEAEARQRAQEEAQSAQPGVLQTPAPEPGASEGEVEKPAPKKAPAKKAPAKKPAAKKAPAKKPATKKAPAKKPAAKKAPQKAAK